MRRFWSANKERSWARVRLWVVMLGVGVIGGVFSFRQLLPQQNMPSAAVELFVTADCGHAMALFRQIETDRSLPDVFIPIPLDTGSPEVNARICDVAIPRTYSGAIVRQLPREWLCARLLEYGKSHEFVVFPGWKVQGERASRQDVAAELARLGLSLRVTETGPALLPITDEQQGDGAPAKAPNTSAWRGRNIGL